MSRKTTDPPAGASAASSPLDAVRERDAEEFLRSPVRDLAELEALEQERAAGRRKTRGVLVREPYARDLVHVAPGATSSEPDDGACC